MPSHDRYWRHDWVMLTPDWKDGLQGPVSDDDVHHVQSWIAASRPLVVARHLAQDPKECVRLGLSLPDKRRIGICVSEQCVDKLMRPPTIPMVLSVAPLEWKPSLDRLAQTIRVPYGVFGSLAWQYFSNDPSVTYLRQNSDLDLVFYPKTWEDVECFLKDLAAFDQSGAVPRIDGEIVLPDGCAVSWRELANRPVQVLIKGHDLVELRDYSFIRDVFERMAA